MGCVLCVCVSVYLSVCLCNFLCERCVRVLMVCAWLCSTCPAAPEALRGVGGILLNPASGTRFVNELDQRDHVTSAMSIHCPKHSIDLPEGVTAADVAAAASRTAPGTPRPVVATVVLTEKGKADFGASFDFYQRCVGFCVRFTPLLLTGCSVLVPVSSCVYCFVCLFVGVPECRWICVSERVRAVSGFVNVAVCFTLHVCLCVCVCFMIAQG